MLQIHFNIGHPAGVGDFFSEFLDLDQKSSEISQVSSTDEWKTAMVEASTRGEDSFSNPSILLKAGPDVYDLNDKPDELSDSTLPKSDQFPCSR